MLRVCVVGSGPSGIYAADALARSGSVRVDVVDRLPVPYGLVRYGVAPDHLKIKSIARTLEQVLERDEVRFLGNIELGTDVHLDELRAHYDAVVYAYGASEDRRLGIPGEDLGGSFSATEFVNWYCGHPDAEIDRYTLAAHGVGVIGVGNVAVDVARLMARPASDLVATDVPEHVMETFEGSTVTDVYVVGRRGPAQAKFTTKELRELGELTDVDVVVDPDELVLDEASEAAVGSDATVRRNLEVLREWAARPLTGARRRIHLRFLLRPVELRGADGVEAMVLERTRLDGTGNVEGTGELVELPVQMVLRSVGYRGLGIEGIPFDERSGTIPNAEGRVLRDGEPATGEYVVGWIKRGPTGVIGTNKSDAQETVRCLLADAEAGRLPASADADPDAVVRLVEDRGVHVVHWEGWQRIDAAELALGAAKGRARIKIAHRTGLLAAALGEKAPA